ncbi:uncharacterized protein LOC126324508 isoform X2 [Schistocerca gregaria]|uniref:uncharacterized protein LOC126324508 isoform X2 n=1 Tax=Schistocerca gregaria TaxID=7010 RepID=UPI00211DDCA8|nr:uncharacterized protein LOC126324508 isoform X2 [Schistocerca gregaria]
MVFKELQQAILDVLPSKDPLDDPDFDAINYMNNLFPNETSLDIIENEVKKLRRKVRRIDEEIIELVNAQIHAGSRGGIQLDNAKASIQKLFEKIGDIKNKSNSSEEMVNNICKDIRDLDYAKRNLSETTQVLNRLKLVVQEIENLKMMYQKKSYAEVNDLLRNINQIFSTFANFRNIDRLKELEQVYETIKSSLQVQIFSEFDHINSNKLSPNQLQNLSDACLAIDAIGPNTRREFIVYFSSRQFAVYELKFKPETSQLKELNQHYQWFLNWLSNYEEHYAKVFFSHWRVNECVAEDFCIRTNDKVLQLLERTKSSIDIKELKRALKDTIKFENSLSSYFLNEIRKIPIELLEEEMNRKGESSTKKSESSAPEPSNKVLIDSLLNQVALKFKGIISTCFEHYMYLYVRYQNDYVEAQFNQLMNQETWTTQIESSSKTFNSARKMIELFSKVRRNAANLNQSQAFFDIFLIFKKYLMLYAEKLLARLHLVNANQSTLPSDEILCCIMINTGEYCASMCTMIQHVIQSKILPRFKDSVVLHDERNKYIGVIASARETLSQLIAIAIEPAFVEMSQINWERFIADRNVLDASPYVSIVSEYLHERVSVFRSYMTPLTIFEFEDVEFPQSPNYFQIICDTILVYFTRRYEAAIYACRKINEAGAQQLLTDLAQFRKNLESLPIVAFASSSDTAPSSDYNLSSTGSSAPSTVSVTYSKKVRREFEKLEKLLKVIWTPQDMLLDTYRALLPDKNDVDLVSIMNIKGISYQSQHQILDAFGSPKDSPARDFVTRDWIDTTKTTFDSTTQTIKGAIFNMFKQP